jgi:hypothetical protein
VPIIGFKNNNRVALKNGEILLRSLLIFVCGE